MIRIRRRQLREMQGHAEAGFPYEVVGILAGESATNTVTRVSNLVNERADSAHNRYQVSGLVLAKAERALEAEGYAILGYYHSHPDHPEQYSEYDRDHALPNLSYVIVSVRSGKVAEELSWRLRDDRSAMDPEEIVVLEDPLATIHIPTPLRAYTGNQATVTVEGGTVGEALDALCKAHGGLAKHLRDDSGKLRSFVNVYLGDEDIRFLQKEATPLPAGAEITIVPSIAGGWS
jgi:molybdopterin synthase sulfur carrier subunit